MGWLKSMFCGVKWFFGVDSDNQPESQVAKKTSPFMTSKASCMYFDEDGDLADEFYEEVQPPKGKPWMRRITENLTWQGVIPLEIKRLHPDFPVAIW